MNNKIGHEYKLDDIVNAVREYERKNANQIPLKIAFLRNITIDPILAYLKYFCINDGIKCDIYMSEYDNVMQEVLDDTSSIFNYQHEVIVLCLKMDNLSEKITAYFSAVTEAEKIREVAFILEYIEKTISGIRKRSNSLILVHNFEVPVSPCYGILDYQDRSKQINTFRNINLCLTDIVNKYDNTYVVDVDLIQSKVGYNNYFDKRFWHIGKAPYTNEAIQNIAYEYYKFIRAYKGRNYKCLVLDCDNTIWGGIVGEDEKENLEIGNAYPGSAYKEFQQTILSLYHRGIILAICSRNNEGDVVDVLRSHPDMILREEHFAITKANWLDKVTNLKEISLVLNIGLNNIVYIDDSEFETNMIKRYLPEVYVITLPKAPIKYSDTLSDLGLFDTMVYSEEDKRRGVLYKDELNRRRIKTEFTDLNDYYKYLKMEITIGNANSYTIARIAQLTKRTNQFNLTTKRYNELEMRNLSSAKDCEIIYVKLKDCFGDYGLIGVAILKFTENASLIDTFLLSCRVLGRCVEDVLLAACMQRSKYYGKKTIYGEYIRTGKNVQVEEFYQLRGFNIKYQDEKCIQLVRILNSINDDFSHFKFVKSIKTEFKDC
jgi:FkbH-like protein